MVDKGRRQVVKLLATLPGAGLLNACDDCSGDSSSEPANPANPEARGPVQPESAPWAGRRPERSLIDRLSFASLQRDGLLIDFGSTDSFKYTFGGWRSGWGRRVERDGVSYTHATTTASRVHFHWGRSEALEVRFRIQRVASTFFSLYVNGSPHERVDISRVDWTTYETTIPAEMVKEGVNHLLFRWETTTPAMGEDVAAAVDFIHIAPADAGSPSLEDLPRQASLLGNIGESPALLLGAGTTLSYWMQVPGAGSPMLGFTAARVAAEASQGAAEPAEPLSLTITAHVDGVLPAEIVAAEIGDVQPETLAGPLDALRNEAIRLDISVSGPEGTPDRVALVEPTLYVEPEPVTPPPATPAKNTIVVMIDTLRADHVSPYGETRVQAPALERFAGAGVVFERYSAVEDWTKPSCATMLTGLYPATHKTQTDAAMLPSSVRMVSEELQARDVATGAFIANGYVSGRFGFERGWDEYTNYIRENKPTEAEHVFADAYEWIEQKLQAEERFFAYVHTIDPHVPYDPPEEFLALYESEYTGDISPRNTANLLEDIKRGRFTPTAADKRHIRALYDGEISYHDRWFGDFMDKLERAGALEDTLVIVVSDHGEEFWERGNCGHGHQIHQELIHVPFIMSWKGSLPEGARVSDNQDHCSLVPTVFDAMGLEAPSYLEGESVLAVARGEGAPAPAAGFSTHQGEREATWCGRYKLLQRGPARTSLFDVDEDPGCENDLKDSHPIALTVLRAVFGQFQGASNKARWRSRDLEPGASREVVAEDVEVDAETREQLRALGYFP